MGAPSATTALLSDAQGHGSAAATAADARVGDMTTIGSGAARGRSRSTSGSHPASRCLHPGSGRNPPAARRISASRSRAPRTTCSSSSTCRDAGCCSAPQRRESLIGTSSSGMAALTAGGLAAGSSSTRSRPAIRVRSRGCGGESCWCGSREVQSPSGSSPMDPRPAMACAVK